LKDIVSFNRGRLILLDQRELPHKVKYVRIANSGKTAEAISRMVVRGAPAIGIAAAFGYVLGVNERQFNSEEQLDSHMEGVRDRLIAARPTAVNLKWAVDRMKSVYGGLQGLAQDVKYEKLLREAERIRSSEIEANRRMGNYGADELTGIFNEKGQLRLMTHCNAGALATGGWGTALGVIRSAFGRGMVKKVFVDETRPRLQGARLTCYELSRESIPYTLISDNMSGFFMSRNMIDAVIVGADRIAANGDVANKIGTYMVAVLAHRHGIPFYIAAPESTFDFSTESGRDIQIEYRDVSEILYVNGKPIAPAGTKAENPAFDITPTGLVTAYITGKGVIKGPDELQ